MTGTEVKELLPIIQALEEGKEIQVKSRSGKWTDIEKNEELSFAYSPSDYRIKPKPKYRPFKNQEECWNEMLKHQPFGWIKYGESICNIHNIYSDSITISACEELYSHEFNISFVNSTFVDGTPFGIKEE